MMPFKQSVIFVHPWAMLAAKTANPSVDIPFDFKILTEFEVDKLFDVNIKIVDNMRANFNKKIGDQIKETFKFAFEAV